MTALNPDRSLLAVLRRLNRGIAILVGFLLLGCAVVVMLDIVLRRVGHSFGGTDEISGYVMAIATSWGMAYALLELGHVRIDLLRSRAGRVGRSVFDLLAMLVMSLTVSLVALRAWPVVARSLANDSRANTPLETPLALVQFPWFAGWVFFALMAWLMFVLAIVAIGRGDWQRCDTLIGTGTDVPAPAPEVARSSHAGSSS